MRDKLDIAIITTFISSCIGGLTPFKKHNNKYIIK